MTASFPTISLSSCLPFVLFAFSFAHGASGADPGTALDGGAPNVTCKMTTTFPDGSTFAEPCWMTVLPAGQEMMAPKGMIRFRQVNNRTQAFNLNFFPPKEIKANIPYTASTDPKGGFLNGIVQPASAHELCRMNREFPSKATITFTAVGATSADYHGTLQAYPACYLNLDGAQETLIPSGQARSGTTKVVF
jgi:hypothetical protein